MPHASTHTQCLELPCEPASASAARRFATTTLHAWGSEDVDEVVALLLTEVVTNALLHAGSPVEVCVTQKAAVVRVEVSDQSMSIPSARGYSDQATTGRGLALVEALSSGWGVEPATAGGKVVWFEVGGEAREGDEEADAAALLEAFDDATPHLTVELLGAPVLLFGAMLQQLEALIREYALVAVGSSDAWRPPRLDVDLATATRVLRDAGDAGRSTADVVVSIDIDAVEAFQRLRAAVDDADSLAQTGALLTPPALPEIRACRQWFLDQVAEQVAGATPVPWQRPQSAAGTAYTAFDAGVALDVVAAAVVAADTHNGIIYANAAAERLLGWSASGLAGQRLTGIIPERLHDAHIAGYSRYLVTREPRLIGRPVQVPARRRDGSEVDVWLQLAAAGDRHGQAMFVASLRPADGTASSSATSNAALRLLDTLSATPADAYSEKPVAVLAALASAGAWQTACWWTVTDQVLQCEAVWTDVDGAYDEFTAASQAATFPAGVGLPGRVWQTARPAWLADVVADSNFPRAGAAAASGLRAACGFPVTSGGAVTAVVELLGTHVRQRDDDLMAAYTVAGRLLGVQPSRLR